MSNDTDKLKERECGSFERTLKAVFSERPEKTDLEMMEFLISSVGEPKRVIAALKLSYKRKLWDAAATKKGRKSLVKAFVKQATKHNLDRWDLTKEALEKGAIFGYPASRTTIWRIKKALQRKFEEKSEG